MGVKKDIKIKILQKDNPVLREISLEIPTSDIKSRGVKSVISDLKKTINGQSDAVAISAVQIGKLIRLFVISNRAFNIGKKDSLKKENQDLVCINPKIIKTSKNKQYLEEGCLSVKYVYGQVLRPEKATLQAYDENGKKFVRGFSGLLAQIIQHEVDHLDGILFIDKAKDLIKISPEEYEKNLSEL
jgi:peptide deformylase